MNNYVSRRHALGLAAGALVTPLALPAKAAANPVLVEFYTSQGCSSCPPADALAAELAKRDDVLVACFHVDYWDYLGWKDTLGKSEFSKRQYDYAKARGDSDVYTPQAIVNGGSYGIGSNRNTVEKLISEASKAPLLKVDVSISKSEVQVLVGDGAATDATVWLMGMTPSVTVDIKRGENAGAKIDYKNVVTHLTPAGMYKGSEARFALPRSSVLSPACKSCVAIVQTGNQGPVLGLARAQV